ncbi:MAG: hypothetical protein R3D00_13035 [Bacteroidia bacterium]
MYFKYFFSTLLIIWGILSGFIKLFHEGLHFPFLTILTAASIIAGIARYKHANSLFVFTGWAWMVFNFELIGFIIFFDPGNYGRMIMPIMPLVVALLLVLFTPTTEQVNRFVWEKVLVFFSSMLIGIGSYVYKPRIETVNCWYDFTHEYHYTVIFTESPQKTLEVELSFEMLKKQVKQEGLQYEGRPGYYCPETEVRVITSFSKIVSAEILSFRNTDTFKKIRFSGPTSIPLSQVVGDIDILKPSYMSIWD